MTIGEVVDHHIDFKVGNAQVVVGKIGAALL
jgi:hypothetical protein